jgi:hypothetical protein
VIDLAAKHNSPLLITQKDGLKAYADFETACSAEAANFDEHARIIVKELMIAPMCVVMHHPCTLYGSSYRSWALRRNTFQEH